MPQTVLHDEWQITFRIPSNLPIADVRAVRRVLTGKAFTAALRRVVATAMRGSTVLGPVRTVVTR